MSSLRNRLLSLAACLVLLSGCKEAAREDAGAGAERADRTQLGLTSSLPLYWPLGSDLSALLSDAAPVPWQREVLEREYELVPLATLSPLDKGDGNAQTDPLEGLEQLAVIQPRGLAPADNVAIDDWVRKGGRLLLVLDPLLTGEYEVPLGSPERPVDSALIPPVVTRWGLAVSVKEHARYEDGFFEVPLGDTKLVVGHPGTISIVDPDAADCLLLADAVIAQCKVGKGRVTLLADAAVFETRKFAGENGEELLALLRFAFD